MDKSAHPGIHFDGGYYHFRQCRDEFPADVQCYTGWVRLHPGLAELSPVFLARPAPCAPAPGGHAVMLHLGILFDGRHYRVGPYRYEHFRDAARFVLKSGSVASPSVEPGPGWTVAQRHRERLLDAALDATFPASDPVATFTPA